ncbi:peptidoglycan-binding domain-containing protein [Streptomyces sp. NPDC001536]|uniref:peptidoglycan-binding domain-containing protein n=1 Tax=Streptomyces sp. NPDC001536 TaxID=3364583 RepID=UPI00369DC22D
MTESNGHLCPECGAPRGADNTPSCACTQRASDALRDARTAEAAAAEDFDPLRIRPYVELEGEASTGVPAGAPAGADVTMPLRPVPGPAPSTRDLSLFEGAEREGDDLDGLDGLDDFDGEARRRPRRTVLLGAAGGLVAVIAAAGLASGLFSYDTPTRDGALPEEVRASVPDTSPTTGSASPSTTRTSAPPVSTPPSPPALTSPSAPPTTTSASPSPSPSRSTDPTASPTPSTTTSAPADNTSESRESTPPVLRRGSQGEEVIELELRLTQLNLYTRKASGHYNEGVEDAVARYQWARGVQPDEYGVYDLETRERLESETQEP